MVARDAMLPPIAKLLVTIDDGQGLLDRFITIVPECYRPTPDERDIAVSYIEAQNVSSFDEYIAALHDLHLTQKLYEFDVDAKQLLKEKECEFVSILNDALTHGTIPPRSKKIDIVQRVALSFHVFDHIMSHLLDGINPDNPPLQISRGTLSRAFQFLDYCDMQKEILMEFLESVTNGVMDQERKQPTSGDIKVALCLFPGRLVTVRAFKQSGPRFLRGITQQEIINQMRDLTSLGEIVNVKIPRSRAIAVFVKRDPAQIDLGSRKF
ncbi:hypothetical protein HOLleu_27063 [Holothuria leucospilota]|uniref:Uncharacterized protein n=1 Tax=Holothuria leucospilota TaxID=206669 RepID=A0A9Q1BQA1_HOLLE|nr:hypothetical protein HOLleu_27063 [Holothuria leucospilota]